MAANREQREETQAVWPGRDCSFVASAGFASPLCLLSLSGLTGKMSPDLALLSGWNGPGPIAWQALSRFKYPLPLLFLFVHILFVVIVYNVWHATIYIWTFFFSLTSLWRPDVKAPYWRNWNGLCFTKLLQYWIQWKQFVSRDAIVLIYAFFFLSCGNIFYLLNFSLISVDRLKAWVR